VEAAGTKEKFINRWGDLSANWGMHRNVGLVQGLLLVSNQLLDSDEIAEELGLSQSNVKTQLKQLMEWELVQRVKAENSRRGKYQAEKNVWRMFQLIVKYRKQKELEPLLNLLEDVCGDTPADTESKEIQKMASDFYHFSAKADKALDRICDLDENLIARTLFRMSGV